MATSRTNQTITFQYVDLFKQLIKLASSTDKTTSLRSGMDRALEKFYNAIIAMFEERQPANLNLLPSLLKTFLTQKKDDDNFINLLNSISQDIKNNFALLKAEIADNEEASILLHQEFLNRWEQYQCGNTEVSETQKNQLNNAFAQNQTSQSKHDTDSYDVFVAKEHQIAGKLLHEQQNWLGAMNQYKEAISLLNEAYHHEQLQELYENFIDSCLHYTSVYYSANLQKTFKILNKSILLANKSNSTLKNINLRVLAIQIGERLLEAIYQPNEIAPHQHLYTDTEKIEYAIKFFTLSNTMITELQTDVFIHWQNHLMKTAVSKLELFNKLIIDNHRQTATDIINFVNRSIDTLAKVDLPASYVCEISENYIKWQKLLCHLLDDSWLARAEGCLLRVLMVLNQLSRYLTIESEIDLCKKLITEAKDQLAIVEQKKKCKVTSSHIIYYHQNKLRTRYINNGIVDLSSSELDDQTFVSIFYKIMHSPDIRGINLDNNQLSDKAVILIKKLLQQNTSIQMLSLNYNLLSNEGATQLAGCRTICELSLNGNKLTDNGVQAFCRNTTLNELSLADNAISHDLQTRLKTQMDKNRLINLIEKQFDIHEGKFNYILFKNHIENRQLNSKEVIAFCDYIKLHPNQFRALSLSNESAVDDKTAEILAHIPTIEAIDLSGTSVGERGIIAVCQNSNLKTLILNDFCDSSTYDCLLAIANTKSLITLSLEGAGLLDDELSLFVGNQNLKKLNLRYNPDLTSAAIAQFANTTRLQSFSLAETELDLSCVTTLGNSQTLTSLSLEKAGIDDEKCVSAFANNKKLKKLNLENNPIGLNGIKTLLQLSQLRSLNLAYYPHALNDLDPNFYDQLGDQIANACAQNNSIVDLNLAGHAITDEGAKALAQNTSLLHLNLSNNRITNEGAKAFLKNDHLIFINFYGNDINEETLIALRDKINDNKRKHEQRKWLTFVKLIQHARPESKKHSIHDQVILPPSQHSKKM